VPTFRGISGWLNLRLLRLFLGFNQPQLQGRYGLIVREKRRYFRCPVEVPVRFSEQHCQRFTVPPSMSARVECRSLPMPHWDLRPGTVAVRSAGDEFQFVVEAAVCWANQPQIGMRFTFFSPHLASSCKSGFLANWKKRFRSRCGTVLKAPKDSTARSARFATLHS